MESGQRLHGEPADMSHLRATCIELIHDLVQRKPIPSEGTTERHDEE